MDEKKISEAVEAFTANPYWKAFYYDAPSEACRRHIELSYYLSRNYWIIEEDKELYEKIKAEQLKLEEGLGINDWRHLLSGTGNNPIKGKYTKKIRELSEPGKGVPE